MASGYDLPQGSGACRLCIRTLKWVPVLFILAIVLWSYYAYVWQFSIVTVESAWEKGLYLVAYHGLLFMFLWSWWQTIFTGVGRIPDKFRLPREELEKIRRAANDVTARITIETFGASLPIQTRTMNGVVRYCEKCQHVKPDRAHHCSVCASCVLKMDHHCPWVNNCVSFTNYKFFVLFLGYSFLYCLFIVATILRYFILFWKTMFQGHIEGSAKFHILFLFFVAGMFSISLVSLFTYHCYLVSKNRSTLEAFRAPVFVNGGADKDGFNIGRLNNFEQVFGLERRLWLLPVFTSLGDGVDFPARPSLLADPHLAHQAFPSLGDGVVFPARRSWAGRPEDEERLLGSDASLGPAEEDETETEHVGPGLVLDPNESTNNLEPWLSEQLLER